MKIVITCKMAPIGVRLNLKNFILISYAVSESSRKVSRGEGGIYPPGEIGLRSCLTSFYRQVLPKVTTYSDRANVVQIQCPQLFDDYKVKAQ